MVDNLNIEKHLPVSPSLIILVRKPQMETVVSLAVFPSKYCFRS